MIRADGLKEYTERKLTELVRLCGDDRDKVYAQIGRLFVEYYHGNDCQV